MAGKGPNVPNRNSGGEGVTSVLCKQRKITQEWKVPVDGN